MTLNKHHTLQDNTLLHCYIISKPHTTLPKFSVYFILLTKYLYQIIHVNGRNIFFEILDEFGHVTSLLHIKKILRDVEEFNLATQTSKQHEKSLSHAFPLFFQAYKYSHIRFTVRKSISHFFPTIFFTFKVQRF